MATSASTRLRITHENAAEYLCECGNAACTETIQMTVSDYENLRSVPTHFAVLPGHELPDVEDVVARNDAFLLVRKKAGAAAVAAELDPRS
jgi:hypothetical protein